MGGYGKYGSGPHGKLLFHLDICSKNADLQGITLSGHCTTTGFGPFELLTYGLLQRVGQLPTKGLISFEKPSSLSQCYEYTVAKQNGVGQNGWSYCTTS